MDTTFTISMKDWYVEVLLEGKEDIEVAARLWPEVIAVCNENSCYKILGIAKTTEHLEVKDSYDHVALFKKVGPNQ